MEILRLQAGSSQQASRKLEAFIASIIRCIMNVTNSLCRSPVLKTQQVRAQYHIASLAELLPVRVHRVARESCWLSFAQLVVIVVLMDRQDCGPAVWWNCTLWHEQPCRYSLVLLNTIGDKRSSICTLID